MGFGGYCEGESEPVGGGGVYAVVVGVVGGWGGRVVFGGVGVGVGVWLWVCGGVRSGGGRGGGSWLVERVYDEGWGFVCLRGVSYGF